MPCVKNGSAGLVKVKLMETGYIPKELIQDWKEAWIEGWKEGWKKGRKEGWEKDWGEGLEKGRDEGRKEAARNLLKKGFNIEETTEIAVLDVEKVRCLAKGAAEN
jgi:predicted transposase YdaD